MRLKLLALSLIVTAAALAGTRDRFAYVYKRGNDTTMRINGSLEGYKRIANRWSGEFIWVNLDGREYLIRDAAVLAAARGAFKEMEALQPALHAAQERLRPIERRFEAIERRMDEVSDRGQDDPALEARLRAAEREYREAERATERLEEEMERREEIAEKKFDEIVLGAIRSGKAVGVR